MNRGWRRCGTYYYKPNVDKSCYTIRMDVGQFKIKKQQRKTIKNMLELLKQKKPKSKATKSK
jgi:arginine-tRNA-protein transferase